MQCVNPALMAEVGALQRDFVQIFGNEKFLGRESTKDVETRETECSGALFT